MLRYNQNIFTLFQYFKERVFLSFFYMQMYRKFLNYKNICKKKSNYFHQKINFIFILNYRKIEKFLMKNLLLSKKFRRFNIKYLPAHPNPNPNLALASALILISSEPAYLHGLKLNPPSYSQPINPNLIALTFQLSG